MRYKLRRCPFCAAKGELKDANIEISFGCDLKGHYVQCVCCKARTDTFYYKEDAIEAWNERV